MSTALRIPGFSGIIDSGSTPIGATVRLQHGRTLASNANEVGLGMFGKKLYFPRVPVATTQTASLFYDRSKGADYLLLRAFLMSPASGFTPTTGYVNIGLSITDGTHTVSSSDTRFPRAFNNTRQSVTGFRAFNHYTGGNGLKGYVSLAALETTLNPATPSAPWRIDVTVKTVNQIQVDHIVIEECPRYLVDSAETYGVLADNIGFERPITDTDQIQRINTTLDAGYFANRTLLQLSFPQGTLANVPSTTSTAAGPFANLTEAGGTSYQIFRVPRRRLLAPGSIQGYFACLYKMVGGAGTETGGIFVTTGVGTYIATLPYSSTWANSTPKSVFLANNLAADFLGGYSDTVYFRGFVSATGPTLYVATFTIQENVS